MTTTMSSSDAPRRLALHCAEPHPLDPTALCRLLSGHGGIHQAGDDTTWDSDWTTTARGARDAQPE